MCYNPINIVNQAKHLTLGSPFEVSVPCGACAACQQSKSLEYEMRAFYEFKDCLDKGGFVYTDCLTYEDKHLPHLRDFLDYIPEQYNYPCFSYVEFRLFMVRLREFLTRSGYPVKDTLRYFMASEYGTSEKCTHRPHYHIIFYCTCPNLDNITLSAAVSRCWPFGRTDGIPFKDKQYISKHTYSGAVADGDVLSCVRYISKYVSKQSFYNKLVFARFSNIVNHFDYEKNSSEYKRLYKDIRKYSFQFHRQSSGFGLSVFNDGRNTMELLRSRGCFIYESLHRTLINVPIPQYFQRKLFYDLHKSIDGSLHWCLNEYGIHFKQSKIDEVISRYALKFESLRHNITPEQLSRFDGYLNGRSCREFAEYLLIYKGRLKSDAQLARESKGVFKVDDPYVFQSLSLQPFFDTVFYNYSTSKTKAKYGVKFSSLIDIENTSYFPKQKYRPSHFQNISHHLELVNTIEPKKMAHYINNVPFCFTNKQMLAYVVNQNSDPKFSHFDDLYAFVSSLLSQSGALKQAAFDTIQRLTSLYKQKNLL